MDLIVENAHSALWNSEKMPCAVGKAGFSLAETKREGDNKTPIGRWVMREVFYRADRIEKPETSLPVRALSPDDGWCENPVDPDYNKLVKCSSKSGIDHLWRDDHVYDIIVVLGHNDNPVRPHYGSAIFLHIARADYSGTAGCVALALPDLLRVLRGADEKSAVDIRATP